MPGFKPSAVLASQAAPSMGGWSLDGLDHKNRPVSVQQAATDEGAIRGGGGASGNSGAGLPGASANTGEAITLKISAV